MLWEKEGWAVVFQEGSSCNGPQWDGILRPDGLRKTCSTFLEHQEGPLSPGLLVTEQPGGPAGSETAPQKGRSPGNWDRYLYTRSEVLFLKGWRITPSFYAPCSKLRHSGGKLTVVLQTSLISEISQICCLVCSQHFRNHSRK